jgi:hypothetical protein
MEIRFNPRDNGACPLCRKLPSCPVRIRLEASMKPFKDGRSEGLEIVIYSCPQFEEKF